MKTYRKWQLRIAILGIILLLFSVVRFYQVVSPPETASIQKYITVPEMGCIGLTVDIIEEPTTGHPLVGTVESVDIFTVLPPDSPRCADE
jgi:hypothetical protein